MYNLDLDKICPSYCTVVHSMSTGLESIKESCTLESSTLAILTLYLGGEGRDHTCAESYVPSRVELSSFIDSAPTYPLPLPLDTVKWGNLPSRTFESRTLLYRFEPSWRVLLWRVHRSLRNAQCACVVPPHSL